MELDFRALKRKAQSFPAIPAAYSWLRNRVRSNRRQHRPEIFDRIYRFNAWDDGDSRSGPGSNLQYTAAVRRKLPALLRELAVESLLDAPCGDYRWLSEMDLGRLSYLGVDIVKELVEQNTIAYGAAERSFFQADIVNDPLPPADLILCRDCLVHLSFAEASRVLANFRRSGSRYLLTTTFTDRNKNFDIYTGGWRTLNLCKSPFNFPVPLLVLNEEYAGGNGQYTDKSLALWRLEDLPVTHHDHDAAVGLADA